MGEERGPEAGAAAPGGASGADAAAPDRSGGPDGATSGRTVPVTVTWLEMTSPERCVPVPSVPEPTAILRAERPTISFYRYLYDTVGADWNWFMRRRLSDEELAAIIHDDRDEVFVLHVRGVPAGYVELDRRIDEEVEIAYFGLIPEYVGRGFGKYLLAWGLARAWSYRPRRVWLHTCTLDHPRALGVYQRAGLEVYHREEVQEPVEHLLFVPGEGSAAGRAQGKEA